MIDDNPSGIISALALGVTPIGFVDPNDPREKREQVLRDAGAEIVVIGAADLGRALKGLSVSFRGA